MLRQFRKKRTNLQMYTSAVLPAVLVGGWLYPPLGFTLLLCMAGAVGIAFYKGRAWCDWMCPRGSFYDLFLEKLSKKAKIPVFFKTAWFRSLILAVLMTTIGVQINFAWGDSSGIGMAFITVLTVTTTAGIVLGAFFTPRAWCQICPMGTLGSWLSRGKKPLYVSERCKDCTLCTKVCPMQLRPYESKAGSMTDGDCIKCGTCVAACPINALGFHEEVQKKAA
ncbi:4Fe-4S binding protein [bacterium]|nr:MAG: 4Fe-4S binding protein [bacterium]